MGQKRGAGGYTVSFRFLLDGDAPGGGGCGRGLDGGD